MIPKGYFVDICDDDGIQRRWTRNEFRTQRGAWKASKEALMRGHEVRILRATLLGPGPNSMYNHPYFVDTSPPRAEK